MSNSQNLILSLEMGFKMARRAVRFHGSDLSPRDYWVNVFTDAHQEYRSSWDLYRRLGQSWDYVRITAFLDDHKVIHKRYATIIRHCLANVEGVNWYELEKNLDEAHWLKVLSDGVLVVGPSESVEK